MIKLICSTHITFLTSREPHYIIRVVMNNGTAPSVIENTSPDINLFHNQSKCLPPHHALHLPPSSPALSLDLEEMDP